MNDFLGTCSSLTCLQRSCQKCFYIWTYYSLLALLVTRRVVLLITSLVWSSFPRDFAVVDHYNFYKERRGKGKGENEHVKTNWCQCKIKETNFKEEQKICPFWKSRQTNVVASTRIKHHACFAVLFRPFTGVRSFSCVWNTASFRPCSERLQVHW